ncbi:MAG: PTS sugar transporter subunit IIA [Spirochaetales bacterium]|nr:PTS sugar transporter subunit IIA [Spirochaetales bacterium]
MLISEIFKPENIKIGIESEDKDELFEELVNFLADAEHLDNREAILEGLWKREKKMSTGIAPNIAIPHTHVPNLNNTIGVLGISTNGIDYDSLDGNPVHLVMMLIGDDKDPGNHLKILKRVAMLLNNPDFYSSIMKCKTPKQVHETIVEFESGDK